MKRLILAASAAFVVAAPAYAQDAATVEQRAEDVVAVFNNEMPYADVFADGFIAAVPEAQFAALAVRLHGQIGAIVGVEKVEHAGTRGGATVSFRFENAIATGPMQLEAAEPHRIAGLALQDIAPINDSGLSALDQIRELPGTTNVLFARLDGSETYADHNAEVPLALGSTFKLYVLSALSQSIANGERSWSDVVELTEVSFPSGQMQDWPQGAPITLHTLATMMISISDNTATDQLIAVLGRDAVEAELRASGHSDPAITIPFMTTREMFLLKMGDDQGLTDYLAADVPARLARLDALDGTDKSVEEIQQIFSAGPRFIDVEWFATPSDIGRVFGRMADDEVALDILGVNQGMVPRHFEGWDYVGYKGGSEPGVLNFSWLLRDEAGEYSLLTMGWNNPDAVVNEVQYLGLAQALLAERRDDGD